MAHESDDRSADERAEEAPRRPGAVTPPRPFDAEVEEPAKASAETDGEGQGDGEAEALVDIETAEPESSAPFEDLSELPALIEALLFVADHPIEESYLARALEVSQPRVIRALDELAESLRAGGRGIRLQRGPEGAQLVSAPDAAAHVERFLGLEANRRLSTAALETLAIIAYRQPVTRGQIDAIRGVSSDGAIQTLRARGLIEQAGHASGPGRPMLLRTTQRFLEHFGLERPGQLPALPEDIDLLPSELSAQLGLDEAIVEEALAQAAARPDSEAEPSDPSSLAEGDDGDGRGDGEPLQDVAADEPVEAAEGVEITDDLQALTEAAEQAFAAAPRADRQGRPSGA